VNRLQLRSLVRLIHADNGAGADEELLARYHRDGDESAFTALVHRYGRLVWAVCRHQTRTDADAEDAFQATFLVFARNAGAIRKTSALGAWLHGVAYRVCAKARKAAQARAARERTVSRGEVSNDLPDSAWDRALAAVHDELARLPETLRIPFVLCCLEGKGTSVAAAQLGWKLGTFSGRLTRAKDLLMARLEARGFSAGALAAAAVTAGAASAPAAVTDRVLTLALPGATIPKTIHLLTQGVIEMSLTRAKLLAAGLIVACGLGTGLGTHWAARADDPKPGHQTKPDKPPATVDDLSRLIQIDNASAADAAALLALTLEQAGKPPGAAATAKWEYDFVQVSAMSKSRFVKFLGDREASGWEFNGQVTLAGEDAPVWLFRRPRQATAVDATVREAVHDWVFDAIRLHDTGKTDANAARIKELEAELARLKGTAGNKTPDVKQEKVFKPDELPLGASEMADILRRLAVKRYGYERLECTVHTPGSLLVLRGDKESVEWATGIIQALMKK
jgi:RNA polymerase sigma factor (sigma-70 family)